MTRRSVAALFLWILLWPQPSFGRAGGGHSFHGASHSYSHSSGGGGHWSSGHTWSHTSPYSGGSTLPLTFAIFILIVIVFVILYNARRQQAGPIVEDAEDGEEAEERPGQLTPWRAAALLKQQDASFSETLFMDFAQLLYARIHTERGSGKLESVGAYLDAAMAQKMLADIRQRGVTGVDEVLVGASRIVTLGLGSYTTLGVEFEGNFTEHVGAKASRFYVRERWTFRRKQGVLSRGPDEMTKLSCPSCGSPSEVRPDGTCPYCDRVVNQGDFQWIVADLEMMEWEAHPRQDLAATAPEEGTHLADVLDPDFAAARSAFMARNPDFAPERFETRVQECFLAIQEAWSSGRWEAARPYETDHLFNTHRYWIEMYKHEGLANRLEDVRIARIVPVRFDEDAFYDIVTVRIHASMRDYVIRGEQVVGGDPRSPRAFSEYWSFIRRAGDEKVEKKESGCPHCGAPLAINMAGDCSYCGTKVTSGRFDWVLSAIEQDESYGKGRVALLPD